MSTEEQKASQTGLQTLQDTGSSPKVIGDKAMKQISELVESGFTMPSDYNYVNAIKSALMHLEGVKDRNGNAALKVCSPSSIAKALFKMACAGLDMSLSQCYPIVYGTELTIFPSYFGNILQAQRLYPNWSPVVRIIRDGDEVEFDIDAKSGRRILVKHKQIFENIDNDAKGAYMYIPVAGGGDDLFVMSIKEIKSAWAQSSNKTLTTHQKFPTKMIEKTVINSGTRQIINGTPSKHNALMDEIDERSLVDVPYEEIKDETKVIEETSSKPIDPPKATNPKTELFKSESKDDTF